MLYRLMARLCRGQLTAAERHELETLTASYVNATQLVRTASTPEAKARARQLRRDVLLGMREFWHTLPLVAKR